MPSRDPSDRLKDMLQAIESIQQYVGGMSGEQFAHDGKTVHAVLFALVVLGEAAGAVPDDFATLHPEIPWRDARALRNLIAHAYFKVDENRIWETVQHDLPPLAEALRRVLGAGGR